MFHAWQKNCPFFLLPRRKLVERSNWWDMSRQWNCRGRGVGGIQLLQFDTKSLCWQPDNSSKLAMQWTTTDVDCGRNGGFNSQVTTSDWLSIAIIVHVWPKYTAPFPRCMVGSCCVFFLGVWGRVGKERRGEYILYILLVSKNWKFK